MNVSKENEVSRTKEKQYYSKSGGGKVKLELTFASAPAPSLPPMRLLTDAIVAPEVQFSIAIAWE